MALYFGFDRTRVVPLFTTVLRSTALLFFTWNVR